MASANVGPIDANVLAPYPAVNLPVLSPLALLSYMNRGVHLNLVVPNIWCESGVLNQSLRRTIRLSRRLSTSGRVTPARKRWVRSRLCVCSSRTLFNVYLARINHGRKAWRKFCEF